MHAVNGRPSICAKTKSWSLIFVIVGSTLAHGGELAFEVIRELAIPTEENQQGVATDGRHLFVQDRYQLHKYKLDGMLVKKSAKFKHHHGGITHVKGNLYCAVSQCTKDGTHKHWIKVYDADSLELVETHDVGVHFKVCAGGIAYRDDHFFVPESFFDKDHVDRVVVFDSDFRYVRTHETSFKCPYGIQGMEYLPETDQFQIHSHGPEFYRINSQFDNDSIVSGKAPFKLQDVVRLNVNILLVNYRKRQKVLLIRVVQK